MKLFKKTRVPDELPDLAIDGVEKADKEPTENKEIKDYLQREMEKEKLKETKQEDERKTEKETEESFITKLQKDIDKELVSLNKLERWYNDKFLPQDIVLNMREHWEKQKAVSLAKILGKNFKEKLNEKTLRLQQLEKEWQNIYFELIEKEEEIKEEERELKKILAEFVEMCKKRIKEKKDYK